ncbi:unnamed protein product [Ceutorhynchus assimilis]|uniref:U6 small nuclear RNA (adenine-(43)-N(6))-methyltransferase n=1 Tax=Ceutorhynchus assimilis TaxID=467358 RepID=A0A9N9QQZ8_9CUCU|nr:unnamed protein product [Ceutorhynchus assimilis]
MSMNKFMHPRNIYKDPPNFKALALEYPQFKKHVKLDLTGKTIFDFKDPEALRTLSATLLKKDFGLDVEIPKNKLVPTIPLRLNYILWIEDLLEFIGRSDSIKGIDIGTGASCVYPLLAAKKNQWSILATETDNESFQCAQRNIENNNLSSLISIIKVPGDTLLTDSINMQVDYDFSMCNPPFFSSTQELHPFFKSRKANRPHPKNAFVASVNEVVAKGGETEFIQKIINESKILGSKIKIYTTMVGQKSNLPALKKYLRDTEVVSFREAEFCQGNTTRWGLAWTYLPCDLRKVPDLVKVATKPLKPHTALQYELPDQENTPENVEKVTKLILKMIKELSMDIEEVTRNKMHQRYFVTAHANTWSHQRKRRREKLRKMSEKDLKTDENENNNKDEEESADAKSAGKRTLDDILCESTSKKLRLSTDSESSDTVFYKFMLAFDCTGDKVTLELNTINEFNDREYLHQIMQFIKNNFGKIVNTDT